MSKVTVDFYNEAPAEKNKDKKVTAPKQGKEKKTEEDEEDLDDDGQGEDLNEEDEE